MKESFTLSIPTSLNHITLGQYQEYLKILEVNKENQTSDFVLIKTVEIFCNSTTKDVSSISLNDLYEIHSHLMGLFDLHTPLIRKFTLKDLNDKHVTFAFVPKLEDITMGEFVDLDTNITDMSKLHNAMAVLYRPLLFERKNFYSIKPYNGYEETAPIFKYMPLDVALGAMVFFYRLGNELLNYLRNYLTEQAQMEGQPLRMALEESGVGINQFMHSLEVMSRDLTKSHPYLTKNVYSG